MRSPLGLQRGTVKLKSYNPEWQKLFRMERLAFQKVLGNKFIAAEHIGSTAIPDIKAKPILDLMLAIPNLNDWEWLKEPLAKLDYQFCRDSRDEQGHLLFVKGPEENRTHYLKITELNSDFWTGQILFRDYLINNPQYREEYQNLKEKLFDAHGGDREPYTKGKGEFVRKILKLAGFKGKIL